MDRQRHQRHGFPTSVPLEAQLQQQMLQIQEQQQLQAPQLAAAAARAGGVSPAGPHMPGSACAGMLQHPMAHAALLQAVGGQMQQSQAAYSRGGAAELDRKRSFGDPQEEEREAKLRRQHEQNKAAQQRYRQRRKERQESMQQSLQEHQMRLQQAAAYTRSLEAKVASLEAALASGGGGGGDAAGAARPAGEGGARQEEDQAPRCPPGACGPPGAGAPAPGGRRGASPGAATAEQVRYCGSIAAIQSFVERNKLKHHLKSGEPLPASLMVPLSEHVQACARDSAAAINVNAPGALQLLIESARAGGCCATPLGGASAGGGSPPPRASARAAALAPAAAAAAPAARAGGCKAEGPARPQPQAGSSPPPPPPQQQQQQEQQQQDEPSASWRASDRRRWLLVVSELALSYDQITQILELRTELLRALNLVFADREALAERLLCESLAAGGGGSTLSATVSAGAGAAGAGAGGASSSGAGSAGAGGAGGSGGAVGAAPGPPGAPAPGAGGAVAGGGSGSQVTAQVERMRQGGYLADVARGSLAVRELLQQIQVTLETEGQLLGNFTVRLMTQVLAPVQAAVMAAQTFPYATDALNLANALSELTHIVPRLCPLLPGAPAPPTAALIAAAAAAAANAMERSGGGGGGGSAGGRPNSGGSGGGGAGGGDDDSGASGGRGDGDDSDDADSGGGGSGFESGSGGSSGGSGGGGRGSGRGGPAAPQPKCGGAARCGAGKRCSRAAALKNAAPPLPASVISCGFGLEDDDALDSVSLGSLLSDSPLSSQPSPDTPTRGLLAAAERTPPPALVAPGPALAALWS